METDPARMAEMLVGLPGVDVLGIEKERSALMTGPHPLSSARAGVPQVRCCRPPERPAGGYPRRTRLP